MKNTFIGFSLTIFGLAILITSCGEESKSLNKDFFGYEYFPMEVGDYHIYKVDSTLFNNFNGSERSSTTFVKEEITESFLNAQGDTVYRLERSTSESLQGNYRISDVWSAEKNLNVAVRTEENLRFNKMIFPITLNDKWVGNDFENLTKVLIEGETVEVYKDWGDYEITSFRSDLNVNGTDYRDVVTVKQAHHDFILEYRSSFEYYAPNIGLIKKEMTILDSQCVCTGQTWLQKAEKGFTMKQVLVDHN